MGDFGIVAEVNTERGGLYCREGFYVTKSCDHVETMTRPNINNIITKESITKPRAGAPTTKVSANA